MMDYLFSVCLPIQNAVFMVYAAKGLNTNQQLMQTDTYLHRSRPQCP
jgi:hypothetical protein